VTVIAWDGNTLAADKLVVNGNSKATLTKIFRVGDLLVGLAGSISFASQMLNWIKEGRKPKDFPDSLKDKDDWVPAIVIEPNGRVLKYERTPYPTIIEDKFAAIGCGRDFALAAMALGKPAREAVKLASRLDNSCGNGVDVLRLRRKK